MGDFELYRKTTIGIALTDTLDEYMSHGIIAKPFAMKILQTFDRVCRREPHIVFYSIVLIRL